MRRLVVATVACLAAIAIWTRGASPLLDVETRVDSLVRAADRTSVPFEALVALAWYEARVGKDREDAARAAALADAIRRAGGDVEASFDVLIPDRVDRRMTTDLMLRKTERWRRLAARGM